MASYVLPIKISSDLKGILEIMLPQNAIVPDLYRKLNSRDVFLVDSRERLIGVEKKSEFGSISVRDLAGLLNIVSLKDYNAEGVHVYRGHWHHKPVILSILHDEKNGIFLMELISVKKEYLIMEVEITGIIILEIMMTFVLSKAIDRIVDHLLHDFNVFASCMQEIGSGNLDIEIPKLEQVEINMVAEEHNRMLAKLKKLMEENIQREVMVKEAQVKSLEKQIDSHFLYNVLDSIKMMAEVKGMYKVSDALLALGRMFRYNLQITSHSVSFQEEISYLENYLRLCNLRYDYCINLSENIPDYTRTLKVPKVILQPIAENSIVHGLDELQEDTTIYLKAYVREKCFYIEMTDMGKGMDRVCLEKVREGILTGVNQKNSTKGIGLHNIHERIRLICGETYGVEIYSKENCYTKVVVKIHSEACV